MEAERESESAYTASMSMKGADAESASWMKFCGVSRLLPLMERRLPLSTASNLLSLPTTKVPLVRPSRLPVELLSFWT